MLSHILVEYFEKGGPIMWPMLLLFFLALCVIIDRSIWWISLNNRVNAAAQEQAREAIGTGATKIAVGCPFCNVMLNDGTTQRKQEGAASEDIEVLDVAALLLDSVKE